MTLGYEVVIGLEVHVQLATNAKIFSPEKNDFGIDPNSDISAVTIAHPGTLPVVNMKAIESGVKIGLAVDSRINRTMVFDRKNYFYPDLPKGYQITQDTTPICSGGSIEVVKSDGSMLSVKLTKIHLEEDAGKSIHTEHDSKSFVDLNRSGVPLIEIVTDPVIRSSEEAMLFLREIRKLVRHLGISNGNMEEGSMRCDANISLHRIGEPLGSKVEVKNMNSIRNVGRAIDYEIGRQHQMLDDGLSIVSETRTFNAENGSTSDMRTKEELNDYRYFPDPDLSPIIIDDAWFESIKAQMPRLPQAIKLELMQTYQLPEYDALFIAEDQLMVAYFKECVQYSNRYKSIANWMMGPIRSYLNDTSLEINQVAVDPKKLSEIIEFIDCGKLSYTAASQELFPYLLKYESVEVFKAVATLNLVQESNSEALQLLVDEVLAANPDKVKQYQNGRKGLVGMFMGQVMKKSGGKIDPKLTNKLIIESLKIC
ncbi:MAG: Asp-tRNA(Asn)/Glu-tRNA(Gln) amidotransferase subunit GatB [Cyclobacteriaceae bacterium]